jgi:hypothetical protein
MTNAVREQQWRLRLWTLLALVLLALLVASCAKPDTSKLSPEGWRAYRLLEVVQLANSATDAVILANKTGILPDATAATILTINKQILDYATTNPRGTLQQVHVIIVNARQGLPAAVDALVGQYLAKVLALVQAVQ